MNKVPANKNSSRPTGIGATAKAVNSYHRNLQKHSTTGFKKMQVFLATIVIILLVLFFAKLIADIRFESSIRYIPVEHEVKSGETLTSIAYIYKPDYIVLQDYMAWVYEHNEDGTIYPGDIVIMAEVRCAEHGS